MRDIKDVVENGDLAKYLADTEEAVTETMQALEEKPVQNYNDLADGIRNRDDLKDKLVLPVNTQKKAIESKKLKKAPIRYSKEAISTLNAIHTDSILEMNDEDRGELKSLLDQLEDKINEMREKL